MLKTIRSRTKYHFLTFLALFYFVIGAHALHPHFHEHKDLEPDNSHQHFVSDNHHHFSIYGLIDSDHHSCPICNYLAVNSANEVNTVSFKIPSFPDRNENNDRRMAVMLAHQVGFQIRGPPTSSPS